MTQTAVLIPLAKAKEEGLTHYFTGKPCKNGHVSIRFTSNRECQECTASRAVSTERKAYMAAYMRERRAASPELREAERIKSLERMHQIYAPLYKSDPHHQERIRKLGRKSYRTAVVNDPEKVRQKYRADYRRMAATTQGKLKNRLRARFHSILRGKCKPGHCLDMVGCSLGELVKHLEKQFLTGMSWENFGMWHIDHIRPCASFDLENLSQAKLCFHYSNLQPLWALDNLRKSSTFHG